MIVKETTYQDARQCRLCTSRLTDHVYTNTANRLSKETVAEQAGSNHKLLKVNKKKKIKQD